jgi:hypothetical protein
MVALIIAIVSAIAAAGSAIFAGFSWRMLAKQTGSLADQVRLQNEQTGSLADQVRLQSQQTNELAKQTELQADQYKIVAASTELQYNLNVMIRLQEVLFIIAKDEKSRDEIWGDLDDGRQEIISGDALLDVVEMALKACERLPNFASNEEDWSDYTDYVMVNSPSIRKRVLDNPKWYPEITPYALAVEVMPYASAAVRAYSGTVPARVDGETADATVEPGHRLLQRIFRTRKGDKDLPKPVADAVADPANEDAAAALRLAIAKALGADPKLHAADPGLQAEVVDMLHQAGISMTAAGELSVQAQLISEMAVTGDDRGEPSNRRSV